MDLIRRHQTTTDETPPWSGIAFKLPVDSDTLSEKLKTAYPACRTLRERKHQAAIDFLVHELRQMQSKKSTTLSSGTSPKVPVSDAHRDDLKVGSVTFSDRSRRPSASNCTSPSISGSLHSPGLVDRARPIAPMERNAGLLRPSTPSTNSQQFVWSAHDGRSMRPKTKRKMTLEERGAYKETRKRGACDKCRKQKGRCTHIIDEDIDFVISDQPNLSTKRRISTETDVSQSDGLKSVKTEHSSDVHHVVPEQAHGHGTPRQRIKSAVEPLLSDRRWEDRFRAGAQTEEYVSIENPVDIYDMTLPQKHEQWPPYSSRTIPETIVHGFPQEPSMPSEVFPSPMINPPLGEIPYQPGYSFYEPPWTDSQDQPLRGPAPG